MSPRAAGAWLVAAALLCWLAWALMPAVGITDTRQIFERVAAQAPPLRASVILQLASAACYSPALEMVAPGIDQGAMVPVMERMQGPNLVLLGPLIAAFFAGSLALTVGAARAGSVPRWNPWLFAPALLALPLGGGLALLACVSASQAWIGAVLLRARFGA